MTIVNSVDLTQRAYCQTYHYKKAPCENTICLMVLSFLQHETVGDCEPPVHKGLRLSNLTIYFQKRNFMDFILSKMGDFEEPTQVIGLDSSRLLFKGLFETTEDSKKIFMEKSLLYHNKLQRIKFNKNYIQSSTFVRIRNDIRKFCYYTFH